MTRKKQIGLGTVVIFIVLILCLTTIEGYSQCSGNSLEEKVNSVIKKYKVQGASFAIIKDGQVASIHNIGYSNMKQKKKVEDNTAFKIASISKTVTAYAVMQLVDDKKLDLDTPVQNYIKNWKLPETKYDNDKVTLRTLMSHTSGISDSSEFGYTEPLPSIEQALTQRNIRLIREPGTKFEYSSFSGFAICQLVIENITGEKFEDYMKNHIFTPLDMKYAGYYNQSESNVTMATPYAGINKPVDITPIVMTGAGGISATSSDMANFVVGLIKYYRAGEREMFQAQKATKSVFGVYGLGIIPHKLLNGTIVYEHNGTLTGWNAQIAFEPHSKNGIVFLCNSDKGYYLTNEVMRLWSKEITGYAVEDKAFEDNMSNIISFVWVILTLISSLLLYTFVQEVYLKKRRLLVGRKSRAKWLITTLFFSMVPLVWYGVMYSDVIFKIFFDTSNYEPFTFFTRNIDWIGFSLILMSSTFILRTAYPKQKMNKRGSENN
jgi:Beta-lactamase class C and other penicillin binding proteins